MGMQMHPDKSQLIYRCIGKRYSSDKQKNFKITTFDRNGTKKMVNDVTNKRAKLLGITFRMFKDKRIDFDPHIEHICDNTTKATEVSNSKGYNICVENIKMRSEILKTLIATKSLYGSRSFMISNKMIAKIKIIENLQYKKSLCLCISSSNVKARLLYGIPPKQATWEFKLLKECWRIDNLSWKISKCPLCEYKWKKHCIIRCMIVIR